jgi:hypothetical protein
MTSTSTVDRKFLVNRLYVIEAEVQKLSPVIAAKFEVNLVKNSTASRIHCKQARTKTPRAPCWPC